MRRYRFLEKEDIYEALNRLRDSFLAAKNGGDVEKIINCLLTSDEKLKIGRRVIIAENLHSGLTIDEISKLLKVGKNTILHVSRLLDQYPEGFELIERRRKVVEKTYKNNAYKKVGGSDLVFKRKSYTGFTRKDVNR